jgi:thiol:disulfide interchange protein
MTATSRRRLAGLGLFLLIVAVAAALAVPIWLLRPFSPQTPRGVQVAYWLRHLAPWATIVAAVAGLLLAARLWRGARRWTRVVLPVAVLLLAAGAWAAQQNVFEKMFAPLPSTQFAPAAHADWVAAGEPVIAVALGGEARAYPVRQLAYHHVVNDVVGGVPIVATY